MGWTRLELTWMLFCVSSTIATSVLLKDTWFGLLASLTGTLYTIIAGKGKVSCYFFGMINSFCYGMISYQTKLFGEVMLNWGYYFPMMFVGLFFWIRRLDSKQEIRKTALSSLERVLTILFSLLGIAIYAFILYKLGDAQPIIDSTTTILSITAMIMTVKRCIEQWILWTIVNVISIYMWLVVYLDKGNSAAILAMWCVALANGIIFFVKWLKEVKECQEQKL